MKHLIHLLLALSLLASLSTGLAATVNAQALPPGKSDKVAAQTDPPSKDGDAVMPHVMRPRVGPVKDSPNAGPLVYHGGSVPLGTRHTYAIYWGFWSLGGPPSSYKTLINKYFADVAADSGKKSNVYYSDTQYYEVLWGTHYISYSEQFSGSWADIAMPASGCNDTHGGTWRCFTDAQIQAEVKKAIEKNGWPALGINNQYFVFLADGISTCKSDGCAFDGSDPDSFCAYHSHFKLNGHQIVYANMPYTGHWLAGCSLGNYPNDDPAADATINVLSHEANEMTTDPLLDAWYGTDGLENGDKCAWFFGPQLGGAAGKKYNQVINGHHYELQQEWSNASNKCVQTGT